MAHPSTSYRFWVKGIPPSMNGREHYMARYRILRQFNEQVAWQCREAHQGEPWNRARVTYTFVYTNAAHRSDPSNMAARVKALEDGLVAGGLLINDREENVEIVVRQEKGETRGVWIEIEKLED